MKFMSIMGFIGIAFIVIAGFMLGAMSYRNGTTIILLYLAIAVIVFFPTLFLFQYAHNVGYYLESQQMQDLEYAFTRQKYYYIWMGVLLILYLAIILFSVVMNMSRGF
jgi:divalent metal cation (Fe/Co/Zn/Cd) transporter